MEIAEHITIVGQEAKLLAEAAERGGLDADVPTCPGWDMRELLRHLGMIHLWAAGHVAELQDPSWGDDINEFAKLWPELAVFWPEDDRLIAWYLETNANLVQTLESAPADVEAWTFLPAPSPLAMWARRQAHETAVHRFDGEKAAGLRRGSPSSPSTPNEPWSCTRRTPTTAGTSRWRPLASRRHAVTDLPTSSSLAMHRTCT